MLLDTRRMGCEDGYGGKGTEMGSWKITAVVIAGGRRKRLGRIGNCSLCRCLDMVALQCFL